MSDDMDMAYVAIEPGKPGYCGVALAGPRAADDVAEWIRDGLEVRLVSVEEGVRGLREYIDARDSK